MATSQLRVVLTETKADISAKFFRGLGDATRIKILELLLEGDKNVSQLVQDIGSPQGRVSAHLACLRWCGYVTARREGRNTYYAIAHDGVKELLTLAQRIVADNAAQIAACTMIDSD